MVAIPSDVFFTSAISSGDPFTSRAAAPPQAVVRVEPLIIMQRPKSKRVVGQPFHRFGGRTRERRDGGMIQINQRFRHREEVPIGCQVATH